MFISTPLIVITCVCLMTRLCCDAILAAFGLTVHGVISAVIDLFMAQTRLVIALHAINK